MVKVLEELAFDHPACVQGAMGHFQCLVDIVLIDACKARCGEDALCVDAKTGCHAFPCSTATAAVSEAPAGVRQLTPALTMAGIPADLHFLVLCLGAKASVHYPCARAATAADDEQAAKRAKTSALVPTLTALKAFALGSTSTELRLKAYQAMGSSADANTLASAVKLIMSPAVRMQDAPYLLAAFFRGTTLAHDAAWAAVKAGWAGFYKAMRDGNAIALSSFLASLMSGVADPAHAEELKSFFTANACPEGADGVQRGFEAMARNAIVVPRQAEQLNQLFSENK
jgi:hypothetical protein